MALGSGSGGGSGGIKAGRAYVETALDMAGLKGGLKQMKRLVLNTSKAFAAGGAGLLGLGGGIMGGILASFKDVVEHFDEIQKSADRVGTTTEALSALGYAAEQSGSNLEDVESAAKFLQKNLVLNADAFKQFGMNADDLKGKDLPDQFDAIAESLQGMNAEQKKAAITTLLGKGGDRLLPLFKDGAEGLRALRKEAEEVGAVVGGENARKAERAGDAISRSWTAVRNTFRSIGAALLPEIDNIEYLSATVVQGAKIVRSFVQENRQIVLATLAAASGCARSIPELGISIPALGTRFRCSCR